MDWYHSRLRRGQLLVWACTKEHLTQCISDKFASSWSIIRPTSITWHEGIAKGFRNTLDTLSWQRILESNSSWFQCYKTIITHPGSNAAGSIKMSQEVHCCISWSTIRSSETENFHSSWHGNWSARPCHRSPQSLLGHQPGNIDLTAKSLGTRLNKLTMKGKCFR